MKKKINVWFYFIKKGIVPELERLIWINRTKKLKLNKSITYKSSIIYVAKITKLGINNEIHSFKIE